MGQFRMGDREVEEYYNLTGAWEEVKRPYRSDFPEIAGRAMVFEREFMRLEDHRLVVEWDTHRHVTWYAFDGKDGTATTAADFIAQIKEKMG